MIRTTTATSTFRRLSRPLFGVLAAGLIAAAFTGAPAAADEWGRWRGDDWRAREGREHVWRAERAREWRETIWRERAREWREAQWRARHPFGYGYSYGYPAYQGYEAPDYTRSGW